MYVSIEKRRIRLYLRNHRPEVVAKLKATPGARFVKSSARSAAHWTLPLDIRIARQIKEWSDGSLTGSDEFASWWATVARKERQLLELGTSRTAELARLPVALPGLYRAVHAGPRGKGLTDEELDDLWLGEDASYQAADVAYGALAGSYLNANKPGLGKTIERIATIYEAGLEEGRHLVVAPVTSLETVWREELERWQPMPVWVCLGTAEERRATIHDFLGHDAGWLVINPEMVKLVEEVSKCPVHTLKSTKVQVRGCEHCSIEKFPPYPEITNVRWTTITADEVHKMAMGDPKSLTSQGMNLLQGLRCAMSGSPMGGRSIALWGVLHWIDPIRYSSKWSWAEEWLEINEGYRGKKLIGELSEKREETFYRAHAAVILRRTKQDVLSHLPEKQLIPVWCSMVPSQERQYRQWERDAEARIDGRLVNATSILDEYTRKMQMAFSRLTADLKPTRDSGKLLALRGDLDELGIYGRRCDEQVVIFSQFTEVVELIAKWLADDGVSVATLTGKTVGYARGISDSRGRKLTKRGHLQHQFQEGDIRVLVMNTKAGGVSINLDSANTACFMDETWNPDDQEQAEDRIQRGTTLHQVTCRYYRSIGTIDSDVADGNIDKRAVNERALDRMRRKYLV